MKKLTRPLAFAFAISSAPVIALAEECPKAPDHSSALRSLVEQAQQAENPQQGQEISNQMWAFWVDAPNEQAQAILDRGMSRRASYDYRGALEDFDALVAYCPDYAEGYNQRAFVHFLSQNYEAAIADLDLALERTPHHVAALSGKALTLLALDRKGDARVLLQQALDLNPWIPERGMIEPGGPLAPQGTDL